MSDLDIKTGILRQKTLAGNDYKDLSFEKANHVEKQFCIT